jgi:hypothetical protein
MLGGGTRDARRTERYLDGLMAADDRRAPAVPIDTELDPAILLAARELRAGLTRVHPSFRFEELLAARLAAGAGRLEAGLPVEETPSAGGWGTVAPFRSHASAVQAAIAPEIVAAPAARSRGIWPAAAFRRLPEMASRPSRPLLVGGVGVGVAGAAISLGAVYVAWRYSHPASGRMGRAVKAAHSRSAHSGQGRRTGVIHGILGVVS